MKRQTTDIRISIILAVLLILVLVGSVSAQPVFQIPWSMMSAGGGKAVPVNSNYTIGFTFGQPFAGRVFNNAFTLTSGFLGLLLPPEILPLTLFWFLPLFMH